MHPFTADGMDIPGMDIPGTDIPFGRVPRRKQKQDLFDWVPGGHEAAAEPEPEATEESTCNFFATRAGICNADKATSDSCEGEPCRELPCRGKCKVPKCKAKTKQTRKSGGGVGGGDKDKDKGIDNATKKLPVYVPAMARTIADAVARRGVGDLTPTDIYTQQLDSLEERHMYAQYLIAANKAGLAPDALERERAEEQALYAARIKHIERMRSAEKERHTKHAAAACGRAPKALRWVSRSGALADKAVRERVTREVQASMLCDTTNLSLRLAAARAARWDARKTEKGKPSAECSGTKRARGGAADKVKATARAKAKRGKTETETETEAETKTETETEAETKPEETESAHVVAV